MIMTRGQHLIGKVLGSCKLEKLLGYGGSSAVFLAQQHDPHRQVAVKVFLPRPNMDIHMQRDFYARFLREAKAASQLDHPHILPIYSYGEQDGLPYIMMPYMSGGTLSEYSARHGALSLQEAQWYLGQIASALDYAHEQGCVHCDVKPANILIDGDGRVMLSDFGIARVTQRDGDSEPPVVKDPESLMGTPDYISPEQALGQELTGCSDIYSLGITLYYLLARQLPFQADTTLALALQHVHEPPPSLGLLRNDITSQINYVVRKALAKRPGDRYQTATDFHKAFERAVTYAEQSGLAVATPGMLTGNPHIPEQTLVPEFIAENAIVRVKPVWTQRASMPRRAVSLSLLLIVVLASIFATGFAISRVIGSTHGNTSTLASGLGSTGNDFLDNHNDWPSSGTFFYDAASQYHILNKSAQGVALALYGTHQYRDFRLSITLKEISSQPGSGDYYGIVFRCASDQSRYYLFEVETAGNEVAVQGKGLYAFLRYDSTNGWSPPLASGTISSLNLAPGASNMATIEARGNTFSFFVNKQPVGQPVTDTSKLALASGQVGLYVEEQGTEVAFSRFYVTSQTD